ncbi:gonadotropin-releasing hormone receptor-like [Uloborus diversus]|uniref:gonadotropin-releasing hormone receptor-like n=1 Tax=Uloborus diversus TaxID=327109 RepID=UPI0024095E46|nr:gonadotropin-releasing hormone receptor-like [Uloborus diversus]
MVFLQPRTSILLFLMILEFISSNEMKPTLFSNLRFVEPKAKTDLSLIQFELVDLASNDDIRSKSSIPFISSVAVTGEQPKESGDNLRIQQELDDLFSPKVPFSDESLFDGYLNFSICNCTEGNCTLNKTCGDENLPHAPVFEYHTLTKVVVLLLIAATSFVGNVATLTSIVRTSRQSTSTVYMLLLQLTVADLLVTIFCILAEAIWTLSVQWYGGNFLCKAVKFVQMFSLYLSTFILVLIGFDRLCAVRFPMRRAHARHHVKRGIIFVWALSAAFSLPQVFVFSVMRGPFQEEFYQCVTYAFYTAQWQEQLYTTLSLILMFLLPLIILITTYITTFRTIASQEKMFSERLSRSAIDNARQKILHKAKIKSLMITVVIVLTFVVCWTPYYVTMIIFIFLEPDEQLSQDLQAAIFFFGSSTAMLNPLIYGAFHLRPSRKSRSSKSTSILNNSSSSRVDNSMMMTLRRSQATRKSREEAVYLHHLNGTERSSALESNSAYADTDIDRTYPHQLLSRK